MSPRTEQAQDLSLDYSPVVASPVTTSLPSAKSAFRSALLVSIGVAFASTAVMTPAYAELIVHDQTSQKINSVEQNMGSQVYIPQVSNNQPPSDTSIIKLMQVMHIDEQITASINGQQVAIDIINSQATNAKQPTAGDKLNKRQRELQTKIQGILGQYTKIMGEGIDQATDAETMTQAYITAAKAYYSQAEVDAQIKFYDTPVGQSILAKRPQVTAAFLQQSLPNERDMSATKEQLSQLIPQMKQIIKDIL